MSHNIEFSIKNNTHSFFSVKEKAWHGLGKIVEEQLTSREAIIAANLDFEVIKVQNTMNYEGTDYVSPGSFSTFRTDTKKVLGSVGKDYTVVQNKDAFVFFDSIVGENKAIFETAGVLGIGEQVFITAKLPKSIVLDNVDEIEQYLLLNNSHDGSKSIEIMFTPIRVVCNNTLNAALRSAKNRIKIRHTSNVHERLKVAHNLLGIHTELMQEQEHYFKMLAETQLTPESFKTLVCNVFLTKDELKEVATVGLKNMKDIEKISTRKMNVMQDVSEYYEKGPGQDIITAKNTLWGAYNAVTGYYQNYVTYNDDDAKVRKNFYGTNYDKMQLAYITAVKIATNDIPLLTNDGIKNPIV